MSISPRQNLAWRSRPLERQPKPLTAMIDLPKLLPCHPQLDHHPFRPFVINGEMPMEKNTTVLLQVRPRNRLTPRMFCIQRLISQYDVLAVERAVALAD